jgi:hypothetical protein
MLLAKIRKQKDKVSSIMLIPIGQCQLGKIGAENLTDFFSRL